MLKFIYYLVQVGVWLLGLIPLKGLYVFSDFLYYPVRYLVKYRRTTVRNNLRNSFPDKSEKELKTIEYKFYHYICDYALESIKTMTLSVKELHQRMKFINLDKLIASAEACGGAIIMVPHYANFEWIIGISLFTPVNTLTVQVYKPLHNKYLDRLFQDVRSRFGGYNVPKHNTLRELINVTRVGKKAILGLVADQSPNLNGLKFWTHFLHQDTSFMDGGERIAKKMNFPVYYCELNKLARGYCEATFQLMTATPRETSEDEITQMFADRVEQTICRAPEYWFWSHKRWKHIYHE